MGTIQLRSDRTAGAVYPGQRQYGKCWVGDIEPVYLLMGVPHDVESLYQGSWTHDVGGVYTLPCAAVDSMRGEWDRCGDVRWAALCVVCVNAVMRLPTGGPQAEFAVIATKCSQLYKDRKDQVHLMPGLANLRRAVERTMATLFGADIPSYTATATATEGVLELTPTEQHAGIEEADRTPATESVDPVAQPDHGTEG